MRDPKLHVLDDPAAAVAAVLAEAARNGESIVLTGGSTPGRAYELAATAEPDWSRATLWWGDERCVPPDDPRSNFGLARRTLLDHVDRTPETHRVLGELPPEEAARRYDEALAGVTLDLLLLGLGPDGHIASLFPGSPQLVERQRLATSGPAGLEPFVERVTMTLPTLLSARQVVFLVTGAGKTEAVARSFLDAVSEDVPASLLRRGTAPLDVYVDRAAAGDALTG